MSVYMQPVMSMPSMMGMHSPTGAMPMMMGGAPIMPMMAQPIIKVKGHKKDKRRPPPINIHMQQHRPYHGMHSPRGHGHRSPRSQHQMQMMSPHRAHSPRSSHSMHSPGMHGFTESMSSRGHLFPPLPGHAQTYHHQQMNAMYGHQRRNDPTSPGTPGSVDTDDDARLRAREGKSSGCCVMA